MKKLLISLLALLLALTPALAAAETVVTSFYPIYLLALNLCDGLEGVTVTNLAAPDTGCLHDYQMSTGDMRTLDEADVFLINGAGMESYLDMVFEALPELPVVDAAEGIELLPSASGETPYNAHIWLDAANAGLMVQNLCAGLKAALPEHAEALQANCDAYVERMIALDLELRTNLIDVPRKEIVTFHEAFPYFARAYGLEVVAVVALEPGDALSPRQLSELIALVDSLDDPPLFTEPQYKDLAAVTVAAETGAAIYQLDPCVTGPESDIPLSYYEDVMRRNCMTLRNALGAK